MVLEMCSTRWELILEMSSSLIVIEYDFSYDNALVSGGSFANIQESSSIERLASSHQDISFIFSFDEVNTLAKMSPLLSCYFSGSHPITCQVGIIFQLIVLQEWYS